MNVIVPIEITDARLTSSTVPEVAPAAYAAGTTYALNAQVSVLGLNGYIDVYESVQAGNLNHAPNSSPTWWKIIGATYESYSTAKNYSYKDRVIDLPTHQVYESISSSNLNKPLDNSPRWVLVGSYTILDTEFMQGFLGGWVDYVTFGLGSVTTIQGNYGAGTPSNIFYRSLQAGNINHPPATSPAWWELIQYEYYKYNPSTVYSLGGRVYQPTGNGYPGDIAQVYESLAASNVGNPLLPSNLVSWLPLGKTNRWAMFDGRRSTATVAPSPLTFTVTPGVYFNAIALLKCVAQTAVITVKNGATTIYTQTITLQNRKVFDWYDWFFKPFSQQKNIIIFNLSPISGNTVTVTLSGSGNVECGRFAVGNSTYLGEAEYGAGADVDNYSVIERNAFGEVTSLVSRANVPKTAQTLYIDKSKVNDILEMREATPATPLIWVGIPDTTDAYSDSLCINGIYRRFAVNLAYPEKAKIDLQLEEI